MDQIAYPCHAAVCRNKIDTAKLYVSKCSALRCCCCFINNAVMHTIIVIVILTEDKSFISTALHTCPVAYTSHTNVVMTLPH